MDGVIIDSEPIYQKAIADFLKRRNIAVSPEELLSLVGISSQKYASLLEKWRRRSGVKKEASSLYTLFGEEFEEEQLPFEDILFPNAKYVIRALKHRGIKVAIASSSPEQDIRDMMRETQLEAYVDYVISGETLKESKPNPEIYIRMANMLQLSPEECIVIEDSPYGIQAGKRAGMTVIARREDRFGDRFDQSEADFFVDDLVQILDII